MTLPPYDKLCKMEHTGKAYWNQNINKISEQAMFLRGLSVCSLWAQPSQKFRKVRKVDVIRHPNICHPSATPLPPLCHPSATPLPPLFRETGFETKQKDFKLIYDAQLLFIDIVFLEILWCRQFNDQQKTWLVSANPVPIRVKVVFNFVLKWRVLSPEAIPWKGSVR